MKQIAIAEARKRLKEILDNPGLEGTAIARHGKPIAYVTSAAQALVPKSRLERREARLRLAAVEDQRLIRHLRIGTQLLASQPHEARRMVEGALERVARWENEALCSRDYIERWRALLALPAAQLVAEMCGDADGWGAALRQNSPWLGA